MLKRHSRRPAAEQVFKLQRRFVRLSDGLVEEETTYGVTSLTRAQADAHQLLDIVRSH